MTPRPLRAAAVRVPGSTSNLGSAFDTIGLALDRYLDASFEADGSGSLKVERHGTLERLRDFPGPDLVAETFRARVETAGAVASGRIRLDSTIPVVRGLGSSAAALVAGCDLARAALGDPPDLHDAFTAAYAHEGHGDNAAPTVYGGLQAVVPGKVGPKITRLDLSERIGFAYAAPAAPSSTRDARAILPETVSHRTAVAQLGRVTALIRGLATADPELIAIGVEDALHVPFRLPRIGGAEAAVVAGYEAGAWGVTISGGGSGLLAIGPPEVAADVASAMREAFSEADDGPECVGFEVRPDFQGLRRV
ncbi:MAG: homoserine kinase [Gemmatimonadota bacterium]|nr:homoserine kinase [Gemmatimonadota bacterium]